MRTSSWSNGWRRPDAVAGAGEPQIVDGDGTVLDGACEGALVIADSWPGQMRTVAGRP